jgi:hypothetical protein
MGSDGHKTIINTLKAVLQLSRWTMMSKNLACRYLQSTSSAIRVPPSPKLMADLALTLATTSSGAMAELAKLTLEFMRLSYLSITRERTAGHVQSSFPNSYEEF